MEVVVVASHLRGYGVWDGSLAGGGSLLAGCGGPAPSLLFLWVTDAQANLLQMELSTAQTSAAASGNTATADGADASDRDGVGGGGGGLTLRLFCLNNVA